MISLLFLKNCNVAAKSFILNNLMHTTNETVSLDGRLTERLRKARWPCCFLLFCVVLPRAGKSLHMHCMFAVTALLQHEFNSSEFFLMTDEAPQPPETG